MRYIDNKKENVPQKEDFDYAEHFSYAKNSFDHSSEHRGSALREYNRDPRPSEGSRDSSMKYSHKRASEGTRTRSYHTSHTQDSHEESRNSIEQETRQEPRVSRLSSKKDYGNTIALFGAYGVTGHYFLKLAVEAGYHVRALMPPGIEVEEMKGNPNVSLITGTYDDDAKISRVVRKAAFVVCMLNDCHQMLENVTNPPSNYDFIQKLVPAMGANPVPGVLLYQASLAAPDSEGNAPMFSEVVKKIAVRKNRRDNLRDQDRVVDYITKTVEGEEANDWNDMECPFQFIITRPSGMVWDRPSRKKLAPSKSLPGPFPITNIDLAEFSLNALKMDKLYNTCPYVVQDGI